MHPRRRGGRRPDRRRALTHGQAVRRDHHLKQRGSVSDPIGELSTSTVVLSPAARTEIPTAARITYKAATTTAARKTGRTPVRSLRLRTSGPELASSRPGPWRSRGGGCPLPAEPARSARAGSPAASPAAPWADRRAAGRWVV